MRPRAVAQIAAAKVRELVREPEALFWVFVFPLLLALALGLAFRAGGSETVPVAVEDGPRADWIVEALAREPSLVLRRLGPEAAGQALRHGEVVLVVRPGDPVRFRYDPARPDSQLAWRVVEARLQEAAGRHDALRTAHEPVQERGARYIDFLIPGLLGMNLMGTGMWGIGFSIVQARSRQLLKRLAATPMRRGEFLAGQILGRLVFLVPEAGILLLFARAVFDVPIRGSWAALTLATLVGAMTFAGLGLLVAARPRTIEGVSGLMNLAMMPMWILSGIFFSTSRFPDLMQPLVQALPLTAVNDALRAVLLEGAGLGAVAGELALAGLWGVASFALALRLFRWQ